MQAEKITYWIPRILAVIFIAFFFFLSFDSFSGGSFLQQATGFIVSNLPTLLIALTLLLAWKRPWAGGMLFIVMGILFSFFFGTYQRLDTFVLISLPFLLIGGLFMVEKKK